MGPNRFRHRPGRSRPELQSGLPGALLARCIARRSARLLPSHLASIGSSSAHHFQTNPISIMGTSRRRLAAQAPPRGRR